MANKFFSLFILLILGATQAAAMDSDRSELMVLTPEEKMQAAETETELDGYDKTLASATVQEKADIRGKLFALWGKTSQNPLKHDRNVLFRAIETAKKADAAHLAKEMEAYLSNLFTNAEKPQSGFASLPIDVLILIIKSAEKNSPALMTEMAATSKHWLAAVIELENAAVEKFLNDKKEIECVVKLGFKDLQSRDQVVDSISLTKLPSNPERASFCVFNGRMMTRLLKSILEKYADKMPDNKLSEVVIFGISITDLSMLKSLKSIKKLTIQDCPYVDALTPLQELKEVDSLHIVRTGVVNVLPLEHVLKEVSCLKISGSQVKDFSCVGKMEKATYIEFSYTCFADMDLLPTTLTCLDISGTRVTNFSSLKKFKSLRGLRLSRITNADFLPALNLTWLTDLDLSGTGLKSIESLKKLVNLDKLDLSGTQVTDFENLLVFKRVYTLELNHTKITDISQLKELLELGILKLIGCEVTKDQIEDFNNPRSYFRTPTCIETEPKDWDLHPYHQGEPPKPN
ncbi:MAG TPA: leucine-rich repeat domain-containing protein [Myxococcota bacterium]|nr:leucine-rich repeat domain-containing protein [Myxococcota bacterium]